MRYFLVVISFLCCSFLLSAQNGNVSWSADFEKEGKGRGFVILTGKVKTGWYVYSQFLESDEGPIATAVEFDERLVKREKGTEEGNFVDVYDDMFGMRLKKFKDNMVIKIPVSFEKKHKAKISITYMTCSKDRCMPPKTVDIAFPVK